MLKKTRMTQDFAKFKKNMSILINCKIFKNKHKIRTIKLQTMMKMRKKKKSSFIDRLEMFLSMYLVLKEATKNGQCPSKIEALFDDKLDSSL